MAIMHRKNSYFYKTENGAQVGDLLMSINTCRIDGINPFEYLTALQRNAERVRANPAQWLPWNYEATIAGLLVRAAVGREDRSDRSRPEMPETSSRDLQDKSAGNVIPIRRSSIGLRQPTGMPSTG